jgi:hypothetical protein
MPKPKRDYTMTKSTTTTRLDGKPNGTKKYRYCIFLNSVLVGIVEDATDGVDALNQYVRLPNMSGGKVGSNMIVECVQPYDSGAIAGASFMFVLHGDHDTMHDLTATRASKVRF